MNISLFYEHVTVLDYAYLDRNYGLVGDSLVVNVEFLGHVDEEGILYDFSYAKNKVKEIIDDECDHRLVVSHGDIAKAERCEKDQSLKFSYQYGHKGHELFYNCPEQALCILPFAHVDQGTLQAHLEALVLTKMPSNVRAVKLSFHPQNEAGDVYFHYTHGLKGHYGNCQRLMHGHRSTLQVWLNNQRRYDLEKQVAFDVLKGQIHFAFWENVVNKQEIESLIGPQLTQEFGPEGQFADSAGTHRVHLRYTSGQGLFEGFFPLESVYFLPYETTVENLSTHFCRVIKRHFPQDRVTFVAFEGVAKGAKTSL